MIMRISSALLPLLATIQTCQSFTAVPSPSTTLTAFPFRSKQQLVRRNGRRDSSSLAVSAEASRTEVGAPGTADLPWSELGFEFRPTKSHLRMVYKDGKWGEAELVEVRLCVRACFILHRCYACVLEKILRCSCT